ncbi:MAG: nickel pincer cofactor biosynthesis protein LarC [Acidimicrobiales bacterium]
MSPTTPGRRIAWFNCFAGIAGDMALGSLVDAGADPAQLLRLLEQLPIGGWSLDFEPVMRNGLACTRAIVGVRGDSVVRTWMHILGVLEEARLPDRVRERAISAFTVLAEAEGRIHRRSPSQVHFHEVGGHDTIVDIVGSAAALHLLDVDVVGSSPVATGTGLVKSAHGFLPNPAPAVVELLTGLPTTGRDLNVELTTPTGAAMLKAWGSCYGPMPSMTIESTGYGAGTREIDGMPNCTQVVIGTTNDRDGSELLPDVNHPLVVLEANVDDATGETLAHALEVLMDYGALDAWVVPVVMKKGRPAHVVSVLTDPVLAPSLAARLRVETGTLGVRSHEVGRWGAPRSRSQVEVEGIPIRVKVSPGRVKAEHDDVARAARRLGRPLIEIAARAEATWRSSSEGRFAGSTERPDGPGGEDDDDDDDRPTSA